MRAAIAGALVVAVLAPFGCASSVLLHPDLIRPIEPLTPEHLSKLEIDGVIPTPLRVRNALGNELVGLLYEPSSAVGAVVVGGGNAMGVLDTARAHAYLVEAGLRTAFYSLQGYDLNEGKPSLSAATGDLAAFHAALAGRLPGEPIALMGSSLTGAVTLCAAGSLHPVDAIVVDSPPSLPRTYFTVIARRPILWVAFLAVPITTLTTPPSMWTGPCVDRLPDAPILFVHHPEDATVPYGDSLALFERARSPDKEFYSSSVGSAAFHMTAPRNPEARQKIMDVLSSALATSALDTHRRR